MKIQSYSDVITNSSSELFVFHDKKDINEVIDLLNSLSNNWRNEYKDPVFIENASNNEIDTYISYSLEFHWYCTALEKRYYSFKNPKIKQGYNLYCLYDYEDLIIDPSCFDKSDCYAIQYADKLGGTPEEMFSNWNRYNPFVEWNNKDFDKYPEISDNGYEIIKNKFKNEILLFSKRDNPDWDFQTELSNYASRYHLG